MNDPENMDPYGPQNHALPYVMKCHEKAQERHQEGETHVSATKGAENREGHSAARTGGASDLPELRSQEELDRMFSPRNGDCNQGRHLVWIAVGLGIWGVIAWMIA